MNKTGAGIISFEVTATTWGKLCRTLKIDPMNPSFTGENRKVWEGDKGHIVTAEYFDGGITEQGCYSRFVGLDGDSTWVKKACRRIFDLKIRYENMNRDENYLLPAPLGWRNEVAHET